MAFCSNCGTELTDGAKFCPKCGTPTPMSAKLGKEEISDEEELQVENEGEKWPIPMVAKVGLILSALLVVYGVLTINTSSFQGMVFIYCIAIGMLLVIWAAYNGYGNMDKKAAYWTIIAALVSFPIIKGADYLFANDETEESEEIAVEKEETKPLKGSKDLAFIKSKIGNSVWTYTPTYGNPIPHWYKLQFKGSTCEMYHALPRDGKWSFYFKSPYSVIEKRLDDGKRHVFVYLKYFKDTNGGLEEPYFPTGINITEGSFIFGAMGAIGYIEEGDYEWD